MALPAFNMRQLLEAGVHFGHQKHRWNPKMASFIFGARNNIHIIDLAQTVPMLHQALVTVSETVAKGGRVLFVGTKRQASDLIAEAAKRSAQYYINHRWLGGTLTNWKTISRSIRRLRELEELFSGETQGLTKKELLQLTRERDKLERALGGIKDMGGVPDVIFVIDTNKESIAVAEARKLNIPVIAVIDTNCNPDDVTHPIPGNDDAGRAITLYCDLIAKAVIDGIERAQGSSGIDVGEAAEPAPETLADAPAAETAESKPAEKEAEPDKKAAKEEKPEAKPEKPKAKAEAKTGDAFTLLKSAQGEADDLKQIGGVGPVLEKKLNDFGIYHYWQIASMTKDDIAKVDEELDFKGRIERDDWIKQGKALAKSKA